MPTIRRIDTWEGIRQLKPTWDRLLTETPGGDFFRTFDWFEVYWRHFGEGKRIRTVVVEEDDAPIGLVPLVIQPYHSKLGRFRTLSFPLDSWGSFYGPIGKRPAALLESTLNYLKTARREWDYVDLRWLDPATSVGPASAERHGRGLLRTDTQSALVDLSAGWNDYWSSRSGNWRSNCRRNLKKLEALENVEHVRFRPSPGDAEGPRWDLYEACEAIAHKSWQGRSTDGTTLTHAEIRGFLRDVHERAAATGCVDLNLLRVGGRYVAFNYNYVYRGRVSSLRLGFDNQHRKLGVGTVLTYLMLQDSFARGDHTFDFLPGSPQVKRPWQTHVATAARFERFPLQVGRVPLLQAKRLASFYTDAVRAWRRNWSSLSTFPEGQR